MSKMFAGVTTIQDPSLRVSKAEDNIGDVCHAHNDLIDSFNEHNTEIHRMPNLLISRIDRDAIILHLEGSQKISLTPC